MLEESLTTGTDEDSQVTAIISHVVILKFDRYNNLKTWLKSDVRREWIERLQPLIEQPESIQTLTGLET